MKRRWRVRQIVVATKEGAQQLRRLIVNGMPFSRLAREKSLGPAGAQGGEMGFFEEGQLPESVERVIKRLGENEVSNVVRTSFGFHLFQVTERRSAGLQPLDLVREKIRRALSEIKGRQRYEKWIGLLKKDAAIQYFRKNWENAERAKVLLTVFALVVFMASPAPAAPAAITIERIVAKINQEIITLSTLQDFVFEEVKNLRGKYKGEELERQIRDIELRALDVLIERMLVLQRAKDLKLKVGDKDLESAIELVMARNRLNVQTFRRFLKVQGTTLEEYRKRMRDQILARRAESIEVNIRVTVNEEEIAEFIKIT